MTILENTYQPTGPKARSANALPIREARRSQPNKAFDQPRGWAITADRLTKTYGRNVVVDELSFAVPKGSIAGFVGPNGAGKTTTLRMLVGLIKPTSGSGTILGAPLSNPAVYVPNVGAIVDSPAFYPGLSVQRNLQVLADLGNLPQRRVDMVIKHVSLEDKVDAKYKTLSLGMKQRLAIASALLSTPQLLILDEPTNGLDPVGIHDIRALLKKIASCGQTILISSHLLAEIEQTCNWLVMIEAGHEVYVGPTKRLLHGNTQQLLMRPLSPHDLPALLKLCRSMKLPADIGSDQVVVSVDTKLRFNIAAQINDIAVRNGLRLAEMTFEQATLEDRFLSITNAGAK